MKKTKNIVFSIIVILSTSCNNEPLNEQPSGFELFVENITVDFALIKWNKSTSNSESEVKYSVYLNDKLLQSNQAELEYSLLNLDVSTTYYVKVVAKNEFGESSSLIQFTTLKNKLLLLSKYDFGDNKFITYEYNANQKIKEKKYYINNEWQFGTVLNYEGNSNRIGNEYASHVDDLAYAQYFYENNKLTRVKLQEGFHDLIIHDFSFNMDLSLFTFSEMYDDGIGDGFILVGEYESAFIINNDGQLLELETTNINNIETETLQFEYTNGNLTKIIDSDNNSWEIEYDNYNNFHTYRTGYASEYSYKTFGIPDVSGLILLDNYIRNKLRFIPLLYDYTNKNNPLVYKKMVRYTKDLIMNTMNIITRLK